MSRNIVSIGIAVAVAVSFLFMGAGAVAAHNGGNDVGVSGHCSDADGGGGGGSVGVTNDGDPSQDDVNAVDPGEVESIAGAVQHLATQRQNGQTCGPNDTEDNGGSYDYLEAHASGQGEQVQVCYSQDTDDSNPPVNAGQGDACEV